MIEGFVIGRMRSVFTMEDSRKTFLNQDIRPNDFPAASVLVITGLAAVVIQTVVLREFLALCQGSEITLGLGLAAWLAGGAAGSMIAGWGQRAIGWRAGLLTGWTLLAVLCPGALIFLRYFRHLAAALPGQAMSLGQIAMASFSTLCPLGLLVAGQYCFGVAWLEKAGRSQAAGRAYGLEALGFLLGGLAFTFVLSIKATAAASLLLCSALCLLGCALTSSGLGLRMGALVLSALALTTAIIWGPGLERASQHLAYGGYEIRTVSSSPYGQTVIAQRQGQVSVFYQGSSWLEHPPAIALGDEETVALGFLASGSGGDVLCLGGWGLLPVLLSQPINTVTLAEPDPWLITGIRRQGLGSWDSLLADSRLRLVATDGRSFMERDEKQYGLIILSLPYPLSLEWNRYYTREFFGTVRKRLKPDGALVVRLPGGETWLDYDKINLAAVVQRTMVNVFRKIRLVSGQSLYLLGFGEGKASSDLYPTADRYQALGLRLSFFSPAQLEHLLDVERNDLLKRKIDEIGAGSNRDLCPRALVPGLGLWQAMISKIWGRAYRSAITWSPALWLLLLLLWFWPRGRPTGTALATGGSAMGMQMLCLWGLQIERGTLYHWLGLGNALFMAGTALGSFLFLGQSRRLKILVLESTWLIWILGFLILTLAGRLPAWACLLGSAISGLLLGLEYPALVAGYAEERGRSQVMSVAPVYAADLAGGLMAAILCGMLLVPAWGLAGAAAFLLGLKLVSVRWWLGR